MDKNIRLNKVLRELNISIDRAIDFLESKSIEIEKRPTTKISLEIYELLSNEFQTDANKKVASNELSEAKSKEKEALRVKREAEIELLLKKKEEEAKVITAASKIKEIKKVGKIELQPTKVKPKVVITNESTESTSSKDVKTTAVEKSSLEETKKNEKSVTASTTTVKEDVKVVNEESESESDTVTTQYKKLSGLKSTGETIDLSKFKSEKKKESPPSSISKRKRRRISKPNDNAKTAQKPGQRAGQKPILKLKIQLLQERSQVLRKFKNKLEKPLKNFKAKAQKVKVLNTEKKKEISTVKKQKMS